MQSTNNYIAFSGGVESTAMCVLWGHKATPIFCDTGFEHQALYDQIDKAEKALKEFHGPDFQVIRIRNEKWGSLPNAIRKQKFYPSFRARYCTRQFKIEPIDAFLEKYKDEGATLMIGLNAEEGDRVGNHGNKKFVHYRYPLLDSGITRSKCIEILKALDIYPDFPPYMKRGGCVGCFYKSKREFEAMVHLAPEEIDRLADLEESIQDERETFYAIRDSIPQGMRRFKQEVLAQTSAFDPSTVYANLNDATQCGVCCNR